MRVAPDDDWPRILEIHRRAFGDEDVPRLVEELRAQGLVVPELSFVAEIEGAVAGHVMNDWVGLEGSARRLLQLSPLGVLPEYQGRGAGGALFAAGRDTGRVGRDVVALDVPARDLDRRWHGQQFLGEAHGGTLRPLH